MQFDRLNRRDVIALLGAACAWPNMGRAQPSLVPTIGFLNPASPGPFAHILAALRAGLGETGYVEGRNLNIEYRWAEGKADRLPDLVADLVRRQVSVIVAAGGTVVVAKAATTTIPIVFSTGIDPVQQGFVSSLNRPGGNVTGVTFLTVTLGPKRLGVLAEAVPDAPVIGLLVNPNLPYYEAGVRDVEAGARAIGKEIRVLRARNEAEIDAAFVTLSQQHVGALVVGSDPFFNGRREQLVALAERHRIPTIFEWREFVTAGGLMSYGSSITDAFQQIGIYTGRILKGEKSGDLPVQQSTKVELAINLKTAKALGLAIPLPLLGRADEVIE